MTAARKLQDTGLHKVTELSGEELFPFEYGTDQKFISAQDLRKYVGGDAAGPNLRLERGARAAKLSDLPNAEFDIQEGDLVPGLLKDKRNVMFSRAQIFGGLVKAILKMLDPGSLKSYTVKTLPEARIGAEAIVTDGDFGLDWGQKVTNSGRGMMTYKVWYNGRIWTVTGR